jgi:outer membrane cobalamin receptor
MIDSTRKYYQFLLQLAAITALWLIANSAAFGKLPDTLIAPEIEVVAEKLPDEPALKIFSVKTINRASLNTLAPTGSLSEALVYAQGVTLKDYGGEFGAKTLSLRGTTAAQSLVVFEGFKLNSAESGAFDISSLPVQTLSNARVVLGGASALFGSGSIGGALLLELADENSEKEAHSLTLSLGSFGSKKMTFSASMPFGKSSVFAALRYSKSDGNYPIDVLHYGKSQEISRDNADYSGFSSLVAYTSGSGTNELLKIFVMLNSGERGSPGAVIQGNIENTTARLFQKGAVASFSFTKLLSKSIIYKARLAFKATKDDYSDSIGVLPTHNSYFNKELQASAALNYSYLGINTIFNCDLVYSTLNSDTCC